MADAPEESGGEGGSILKKYGPLAAIVLLAQVVLAWVVIQFAFKDKMPEKEGGEARLDTEVEQVASVPGDEQEELPYDFTDPGLLNVIANPAGTNSERFVVIDVALGLVGRTQKGENLKSEDLAGEEITKKIQLYMPRIRAAINQTVRSKRVDELEGDNLDEVREEIRKKLNQEVFDKIFRMEEGEKSINVQEVIFSRIILQ